jgi:hypothetical protein
MLLFFTLAALSVVTVGSVVAYQRGVQARLREGDEGPRLQLPPPPAEPEPATERRPETLRLGDVVVDGSEDWLIVGTVTYREEGDTWWLHRLDSGREQRWMEVRDRDGVVVCFFEEATDIPAFGKLYDGLTHKGMPFQLSRRGDARVSIDGEVGAREEGVLQYATYRGPGGAFLNVDEPESGRVALTGQRVVAEGLMLMPGERPEGEQDLLAELDRLADG